MNWAWPHTPRSDWALLLLSGGPFSGERAAFLPPDVSAPAQIVWSGWMPWGFCAYLYEWRGETLMEQGRTAALIYRPPIRPAGGRGQRVPPEDVPPAIGDDAELYADAADMLIKYQGFPGIRTEDWA